MKSFRYTLLFTLSLLVVAFLSACQPVRADVQRPLSVEEQNLAIVQRFYDEYANGNADVILELHPETLHMHYAGEAEDVPTQLLYEDLAALKQANPELHAEIHSMFAQGDIVVTELTWTTTHTGDYFGIPATGETSRHSGIVVRRLENGKIVESWEIWDDLAFLESIGYLPSWDEIVAAGPTSMEKMDESVDATGSVESIDIVQAFLDALVAKDLDAAVATLADDVSHTDTHAPPGLPSLTAGKEAVSAYFGASLGDSSYELEYSDLQMEGDQVSWATKEWFDAANLPPNFPLPIESHLQAVVADGKITSILLENDPAWLEKLWMAIPPRSD